VTDPGEGDGGRPGGGGAGGDGAGPPGADGVLDRLFERIESRRDGDPETSYTARLFARGIDKIAQKTGEEAVEAVIEAVRRDPGKLADESADLLYHLLVLWAASGLRPADVLGRLQDRVGRGGLDEKKSRLSG
jgi:phosphoribosyl-ATP pyrophosphohydrolase